MSSLEIIKCPACSSSSIKTISTTISQCEYCGSRFKINNGALLSHTNSNSGKHNKKSKKLLIASLLLLLVGAGFSLTFFMSSEENKPQSQVQQKPNQQPAINSILKKPLADIPKIKAFTIEPANEASFDHVIDDTSSIKILSHVTSKTANGDNYWISTIINNGQETAIRAGVVVSLFDKNGKRVGEQKGYAKLKFLKPQQKANILTLITKAPSYAKAELATFASRPNNYEKPYSLLKVEDYNVKVSSYSKKYHDIIGEVSNHNDHQVDYSKIVVLAKDENDQTIGIADGYLTHASLKPQATSGFKVTIGSFQIKPASRYTLYAFGQKHRE